jgi:hypothetical protein
MYDTHDMDTAVAQDMIRLIRAEADRRVPHVVDDSEEAIEAARDQWLSSDEPFLNELCLLLLVALRHQVERELVRIAARTTDDGEAIGREQYREKLKAEREYLKQKKYGWKRLIDLLKLRSYVEWNSSMETLRLLANCYKHDLSQTADEEFLKHLKSDLSLNYMPLAESGYLRQDIAASLSLEKDADYWEIAEEFASRVEQLLTDVRSQPNVSKVKGGKIKFSELTGY